ncbi:hypothetical protein [Streptomyces otsuchiensis]|uniref:hypothetical protein n=1 Tax=Streptomyces otsuchiensis TaxID=2681388 RepID=UPI0027D98481|nr:hypothetical protein [Streptomyces otsuchiensis]
MLAVTPTHDHRDPALLRRWAETADRFGAELAPGPAAGGRAVPAPALPRVVERTGGLDPDRLLLARYTSRPAAVELYTDTIAFAEALVSRLGWRHWYPRGSVRRAALAHEELHCRLHHGPRKAALKAALGHTALRIGPVRVAGHVAGADEIAAHAYARAAGGLGRSPLLLTAALAHAVTAAARPATGTTREN